MKFPPVDYSCLPAELLARLAALPLESYMKLCKPPERGDGHREIYRDACFLRRHGFSEWEFSLIIRARYRNFYREVPDREIEEAYAGAGSEHARGRSWPTRNDALVREAVSRGYSVEALRASSPTANPEALPTEEVLDRLFKDEELLCLGDSRRQAFTRPRNQFRGTEHNFCLIVPNPMSKETGLTRAGNFSPRSLNNTGPSRIQVVEFDTGTLDEQSSLLKAIVDCGVSLRMVVFSGKKSLHGWFDVAGWSEEDLIRLRRYAAALGADTATFTANQFVRTPNAYRDNGKQQTVLFLR